MSFSFAAARIPLVISHSFYLIAFGVILFGGIRRTSDWPERPPTLADVR